MGAQPQFGQHTAGFRKPAGPITSVTRSCYIRQLSWAGHPGKMSAGRQDGNGGSLLYAAFIDAATQPGGESCMTKDLLYVAAAAAAIALGVFIYVADAPAYGGTSAATCNNCHVMDAQYENWYHAGHANVAVCVECHLPHQNIFAYYLAKGKTGMHDVYFFSTGQTPELIRAKPETRQIIQDN